MDCRAPAQVVIERMSLGDIDEVVAIEREAFASSGNRDAPEGGDATWAASASSLREELARPWSCCWVARTRDPLLVAFLVAWHVADEVHILNVATDPSRRRRGFARALMDQALAFARANAVRLLLLEVRRSNRAAIALYRALGFSASGVRRRYYPDDEDAIEMMLTLDRVTGDVIAQPDDVQLERLEREE